MKKLALCALLVVSVNTYATVTGNAEQPMGSMYQRQVRPIANRYDFTFVNTTALDQTYFLRADLCPGGFNCKVVEREITLHPGETASDSFKIQMDVGYNSPGNYPVGASLNVRGESNLDIRRNGTIYVNS